MTTQESDPCKLQVTDYTSSSLVHRNSEITHMDVFQEVEGGLVALVYDCQRVVVYYCLTKEVVAKFKFKKSHGENIKCIQAIARSSTDTEIKGVSNETVSKLKKWNLSILMVTEC